MSGGSTTKGSQITSSEPWGPTQPHLKNVMGEAEDLYDSGNFLKPYKGSWYAGMSDETKRGLGATEGIADFFLSDPGIRDAAFNTIGSIADLASGQRASAQHDDFLQISDTNKANYLSNVAGYNNLLGGVGNEAFQSVLDEQAGALGDDITRQFGGEAFGSPIHSDTIARQVGDFRNRMASDNWHQNIADQRGVMGDLANYQSGALSQQQNILGGMTGLDQIDIQNQLAGIGAGGQLMDVINKPAQMMMGVGAAYDQDAANRLQADMARWNADQRDELDRLSAYSALVGGYGGMGGTTTQTVNTPSNPFTGALGGALVGSQVAGPIGAIGGGTLGLLGGL